MYQRLTVKTAEGYEADGVQAAQRLGQMEDAIDRLQAEYSQTVEKLESLSAQGKERSATYRQLWANKMTLRELLFRLGCM